MRRREFIASVVGAAAWPFAARAQQREWMRRIGVLMNIRADGPDEGNWAVFLQTLQQLGWIEGRNVQIETRSAADDAAEIRRHAAELVAAAPDVIVSTGNAGVGPLLQETRIIPIVFNNVVDPIGAGFVATMARPGGNATGFLQFEYTLSGKWLELLKEVAPRVTRAAILRDPAVTSGIGQFAVIQSVAPLVGVDVSAISLHDAGEIDRAVTAFARSPNGGLILTASRMSIVHRELIIALAARYKLPAVYPRRYFAASGGLISYGHDFAAQFRDAARYVDRVLKGEKPADLPVQAPTRYEMVLNLKTAKTLGLDVPETVHARADEVIQ
jgi:putative tryptophan/tyrosine transport system substrate-binding protein